jgi:hypothetical protein
LTLLEHGVVEAVHAKRAIVRVDSVLESQNTHTHD